MPSLPDGVGVGVQYNFTITFDQYMLYSHLEQALIGTQSYLETVGNPTLEPFDETYTSGSGRTISIAVSTVLNAEFREDQLMCGMICGIRFNGSLSCVLYI